jgi:primosomal protein N' (replication factor Y)
VTLVGVVNADVGLHFPDFRSAERTFQLLSQVAGRAGRGPQGGHVLIQTFTPEHPSIGLAATHDYAGFVAAELEHRRHHNYPPYQRLARIIVRSRDQQAASAFADQLADAFHRSLQTMGSPEAPEVRVLGPAEAPVFRLKGYYRFHFQLQSPSSHTLHQLLRSVLPAQRTPAGVEFTLDVDPFNML